MYAKNRGLSGSVYTQIKQVLSWAPCELGLITRSTFHHRKRKGKKEREQCIGNGQKSPNTLLEERNKQTELHSIKERFIFIVVFMTVLSFCLEALCCVGQPAVSGEREVPKGRRQSEAVGSTGSKFPQAPVLPVECAECCTRQAVESVTSWATEHAVHSSRSFSGCKPSVVSLCVGPLVSKADAKSRRMLRPPCFHRGLWGLKYERHPL